MSEETEGFMTLEGGDSDDDLQALSNWLDEAEKELDSDLKEPGEQIAGTFEEEESRNQSADTGAKPAAQEAKPEQEIDEPFKPKEPEAEEPQQEEPKPEDTQAKDEDKYQSKYQKELARQAKSWEKINAEKEAIRAEKERLEQERLQFVANQSKQSQESQFKADDFEQAAKDFESEGKDDLAELARARAEELRNEPSLAQKQMQQEQAVKFDRDQRDWWTKAKVEMPQIVHKGSEANKRLTEMLQKDPTILNYERGPYVAAKIVMGDIIASRASGLESENADLKKKVEKLELDLSDPGAQTHVGVPSGEKPWDQMTTDEQEAALRREIASA